MRLVKKREDLRNIRLTQLRNEIDKGIKQLDAGKFKTYDEKSLKQVFEGSKARGRKKLSNRGTFAA